MGRNDDYDEDDYEDEEESSEIAVKGGNNAVANLKTLGQQLAGVAAAAGGGERKTLMKMTKQDGSFSYGREETQVERGSEWAINPFEVKRGLVAWAPAGSSGKKKLGEIMVNATMPQPGIPTGSQVDPSLWEEQFSLDMKCMGGRDDGMEAVFKTSSIGGRDAVADLLNLIAARAASGKETVVPVIVLESTSYQHRDYGKIYKPHFRVLRWVDMNGLDGGRGDPAPKKPHPSDEDSGLGKPVRRPRVAA
jgi:hypothetical protein